jgi:hypothetical protein
MHRVHRLQSESGGTLIQANAATGDLSVAMSVGALALSDAERAQQCPVDPTSHGQAPIALISANR